MYRGSSSFNGVSECKMYSKYWCGGLRIHEATGPLIPPPINKMFRFYFFSDHCNLSPDKASRLCIYILYKLLAL